MRERSSTKTTRSLHLLLPALVLVALGLGATRADARPQSALLAYGKLGGLIPVGKLAPHVSMRIGGGYVIPALKQRLAFVVDLGYSQTNAEETISDPRLGESGADYTYELTEHDLNLFLGPQLFIRDPFSRLVPYATAGLDLHFLRSDIEGVVGGSEPLGRSDETATKVGFALRAGVGYRIGSGLITGEVSFAWAPIDHQITGDSHLGRLAFLVGYTAMLGL